LSIKTVPDAPVPAIQVSLTNFISLISATVNPWSVKSLIGISILVHSSFVKVLQIGFSPLVALIKDVSTPGASAVQTSKCKNSIVETSIFWFKTIPW